MKYSIIIPARDESGNIGSTLNRLRERLTKENIDYEIIVVDDGSKDHTRVDVEQQANKDPDIHLVVNEGRHGFGYAVRCGLDAYTGQAVCIVMADGSDDPEDVVKYYYILQNQSECAFGSRWIKGGRAENYPPLKKILNRLANKFVQLLFRIPYNDVTNAFKGYRRCVVEGCRPFLSPHFNLTVELPLKAIVRGYTYAVVPISWKNRIIGKSALHIEEMGSRYLYIVLNIWLEKMLTHGDYRRSDGADPPSKSNH